MEALKFGAPVLRDSLHSHTQTDAPQLQTAQGEAIGSVIFPASLQLCLYIPYNWCVSATVTQECIQDRGKGGSIGRGVGIGD